MISMGLYHGITVSAMNHDGTVAKADSWDWNLIETTILKVLVTFDMGKRVCIPLSISEKTDAFV